MAFIKNLQSKIASLTKKQRIITLLVLVGLFVVLTLIPKSSVVDTPINETRSIELISVLSASTESSPLQLTGTVRSESEALLRTETQGEVIGVYSNVGSFVTAGTVIAELRNNSERASVAQAEAAVEGALANLEKGTGGVRDEEEAILQINYNNAQNSVTSAKTNAVTTLRNSYASIDNAIVADADSLFSNPSGNNPVFNLATSKSEVVNRLVQNRVKVQQILNRQRTSSATISINANLASEIEETYADVTFVRAFLDDMLIAINNAIPTTSISQTAIESFKQIITSARSSVSMSETSLRGAQDALNNANSTLQVSLKNLERGTTGAQVEDVRALQAAVEQARAGLSQARANLARTLIVSPISGTINTLSLRRGEFANAFELAAVISNNNALEVEAYISENDKNQIRVGSKAIIDTTYQGVVTSVAPGIDPVTKKIEVRIGVIETNTDITHNSSVRVTIDRNGFEINPDEVTQISIPISALKIETNRTVVFTVDADDTLVAHEVKTGLVLGDSVDISDGLTSTMSIVKDARGLREGQIVEIVN